MGMIVDLRERYLMILGETKKLQKNYLEGRSKLIIFATKKKEDMATLQIQNSQHSIADALWTLIKSQPKRVQQALAQKIKDEFVKDKVSKTVAAKADLSAAYAFIDTIPATGGKPVPADEKAIDVLIEEKYKE